MLLLFPFAVIIIGGLFLPVSKAFTNSLYFSLPDKDKLLMATPGPRIIFIGGSNLSFGLDSRLIKDSLHLNPINTAIHVSIGLKFMLNHTMNYVKEGDIVVISPEYEQFYNNVADGDVALLAILLDVSPAYKDLDFNQYLTLAQIAPSYAKSKIFQNYLKIFRGYSEPVDSIKIGYYDRRSFNEFGDEYIHWYRPRDSFRELNPVSGKLNEEVFKSLNAFRNELLKRKAKMYITFPCYQELLFNLSLPRIKLAEKRLKENGFNLLGTPERYKMNDSLIYDTPYHLTREGVTYRTNLLIGDLKKN